VAFIGDEIACLRSRPSSDGKEQRNMQRRGYHKQTVSLGDRLAHEAARLREQAANLPHGIERDELLRKARQADTAVNVSGWLSSPGLKPPT
jgi:hypothetical protein